MALVVLAALWSAFCLWRAASAGSKARSELVAVETSLKQRDVAGARRHLASASSALDGLDHDLGHLGPIRSALRITPFVRVQLRGIEAYLGAGRELTTGATRLTDALDGVLNPTDPNASIATTLQPMRAFESALQDGVASLDRAMGKVDALNGYRLVGPLNSARHELGDRLPAAKQKAQDALRSVSALLTVIGGDGPRRFLVLAQNPDEVRPTGGYAGSYGVLEADGAQVHLDRFEGTDAWNNAHPDVAVPTEDQAAPFLLLGTPKAQHLSNVNATIDWPADAPMAKTLWAQGGEAPVDGVLLITPDLLARVLKVLGPVQVPEYAETVSADNLLERLDFHTHEQAAAPGANRKEFLSALAQPVMHQLLHAPSTKWVELGEQLAAAFDAREAMAWSTDQNVTDVLQARAWDGALPNVGGDFFADSEFEYEAKNGRGLQRTFDHVVHVEGDGSATVETTMTLANTLPFEETGKLNIGATIYAALYGPAGATLAPSADVPDVDDESSVSGHPAAGYVLRAAPLATASKKIAWHVPNLLVRGSNGTWQYSLRWWHIATNANDTLHLDIRLPDGWSWVGPPPPTTIRLDQDVDAVWSAHDGSGG